VVLDVQYVGASEMIFKALKPAEPAAPARMLRIAKG
jgi:hypothetical protein